LNLVLRPIEGGGAEAWGRRSTGGGGAGYSGFAGVEVSM